MNWTPVIRSALLAFAPVLPTARLASQQDAAGPAAAAAAIARLAAEAPTQRVEALAQLAHGPASQGVLEAVALRLGDRELAVRRAAIDALLSLRDDLGGVREELLEIADHGDVVRWQTALDFGGRFAAAPNAAPHLAALQDRDPDVRRKAVAALCRLGDAAAPHRGAILALLQDPVADVRAAVACGVGQIGWDDAIRGAVIAALVDPAAAVRQAAAETLGRGHDDPQVVDALRRVVQDPDVDVRANALRGLGRCPQHAAVAAADVVASLRDREAKVRVAALEATASLQLADERALREARRCLDDDDRKVLLAALRTVARQQQAAAAALPRIVALIRHRHAEVRVEAVAASWAVSPDDDRGAAVLRLVEALTDDQSVVRSRSRLLLEAFVDRQ